MLCKEGIRIAYISSVTLEECIATRDGEGDFHKEVLFSPCHVTSYGFNFRDLSMFYFSFLMLRFLRPETVLLRYSFYISMYSDYLVI